MFLIGIRYGDSKIRIGTEVIIVGEICLWRALRDEVDPIV